MVCVSIVDLSTSPGEVLGHSGGTGGANNVLVTTNGDLRSEADTIAQIGEHGDVQNLVQGVVELDIKVSKIVIGWVYKVKSSWNQVCSHIGLLAEVRASCLVFFPLTKPSCWPAVAFFIEIIEFLVVGGSSVPVVGWVVRWGIGCVIFEVLVVVVDYTIVVGIPGLVMEVIWLG